MIFRLLQRTLQFIHYIVGLLKCLRPFCILQRMRMYIDALMLLDEVALRKNCSTYQESDFSGHSWNNMGKQLHVHVCTRVL